MKIFCFHFSVHKSPTWGVPETRDEFERLELLIFDQLWPEKGQTKDFSDLQEERLDILRGWRNDPAFNYIIRHQEYWDLIPKEPRVLQSLFGKVDNLMKYFM